jgi:LacI family transcriptional regulator
MPTFTRVTIKDVAAASGFSIATVSMALRNHPGFPASTVETIKRTASTLGYRPDPALSALSAYRNKVKGKSGFSSVVLVSNWDTAEGWRALPTARSLEAGIRQRAFELGYEVQHMWARRDGASVQRFASVLLNRGLRGLILAPFQFPDESFDLPWSEFSVVTVERPLKYPLLHHVCSNSHADMRLVWQQARARGYCRIGLVIERLSAERVDHQWDSAHLYEQSLSTKRSERVPTLYVNHTGDLVGEISGWISRFKPDLIISRRAEVHVAATQLGLRIPRDLGYISLNTLDDRPRCSGIVQNRSAMGGIAMDLLNSLLMRSYRGFNEACQSTYVDSNWMDGNTTRPPG